MNSKRTSNPQPLKARTGIEGFDEITNGGVPRGRTTLLEGSPGSGKTVMALETLVNGARLYNEPGIFVAFEESSARITTNATKFGWDLAALQRKKLFFLDAQQTPDLVKSGSFDLGGMLAAIGAKAREIKAKRIVFDAVDLMLALLHDPVAEEREMYRLHEWLLDHELTAIITAKIHRSVVDVPNRPPSDFMQFMVDCAVVLNNDMVRGVSQRNLRVVKYRGCAYSENAAPFLIGKSGLQVAGAREVGRPESLEFSGITKKVSTGVARLDAMLGGGYYRGAGILVTGFTGTAKSTLGGAFAKAACQRGEKTLLFSFDSDAKEVIRNLVSVGIHLLPFVKNGVLRLVSARAVSGSAEIHLMQIKTLAKEHRARCLIIDPVSALAKAGNEDTAYSVAERLVDWAKSEGITLFCTSLLREVWTEMEGTALQISTLADTWIHLNYQVKAGERNRGLSIIKSRGTAHSNQVRELILSSRGVTLADAYTAGGEVLMGTLRWEKECAVRAAENETHLVAKQKRDTIEAEEAEIEVQLKGLRRVLEAKRAQKRVLSRLTLETTAESLRGNDRMRELRGVDIL
jgi:circadian clock protein KaiC